MLRSTEKVCLRQNGDDKREELAGQPTLPTNSLQLYNKLLALHDFV
jgi:hypothetical protein